MFSKHGWTIDQIPLQRLIHVPIALVDVSFEVSQNSSFAVSVKDFLSWEKKHGHLPDDSLVVVYTGWGKVGIPLFMLMPKLVS